ncbi:DUF1572 family protein [Pseudobacillus badius]|uniref:DUF1572 family protein n=1 Tax=Bacillus badius TaxID=1455 RepID=UPI0007B3B33E|nr:DUF1572 family protein [Bacillus badius]KZR60126.1 hypothetical protein A3781_07975 [Bacillus badius]
MNIGKEYLKVVREKFQEMKNLGEKAVRQLSEEQIHWVFNEQSNSVAVIIKHVSGNMKSRWSDFLVSDGEKPDRNREQEFEDKGSTRQELMDAWEKGWEILFHALDGLEEQDLLKTVLIRGERHTVLEAIERQIVHYSAHIGQILYIGKQLKGDNWESLSIPKGKSEEFLQQMLKKNPSQ